MSCFSHTSLSALAQAMQLRKPVIASDLASLREQAAGYGHVDFVPVGSETHLADKLRLLPARDEPIFVRPEIDAEAGWDHIAELMAIEEA